MQRDLSGGPHSQITTAVTLKCKPDSFRNQETYSFLNPGQAIHFSEYWMPVRGTGGISSANKTGVVRFNTHGSDVSVALNVNQRIDGGQDIAHARWSWLVE